MTTGRALRRVLCPIPHNTAGVGGDQSVTGQADNGVHREGEHRNGPDSKIAPRHQQRPLLSDESEWSVRQRTGAWHERGSEDGHPIQSGSDERD